MYLQHFQLKQFPFTLTPNTNFFFESENNKSAIISTSTALQMGEGFVKIVGEVGSGKTMLCRQLMRSLPAEFVTAYVANPQLNPIQLFHTLVDELYVSQPSVSNAHTMVKAITGKLLALRRRGRRTVLIVDEAQAMPLRTLETLRLLTNIETEDAKLLQIVLFGQPELDENLKQPEARQLAQRIVFSQYLKPMDTRRSGLENYIIHRLKIAGHVDGQLFTRQAVKHIARSSRGIPRVINILCHKALIAAFGRGSSSVNWRHALAAVQDSRSIIASTRVYAGPQLAQTEAI